MRVLSIKAHNFRNYKDLDVAPDRGVNVIRGKNAQGKTNFIESLFFVLRGFSFRAARENEVLTWGSDYGYVEAAVEKENREVSIRVSLTSSGKRILLAQRPVGRTELGRGMGVVLFIPDDLRLVKGAPRDRRRFLDLELGYFVPGYLDDLKFYQRALNQRNHLLRLGGRSGNGETLALWTERFCYYGAGVLAGRLEILKQFAPLVCRLFSTWGREELTIKYRSFINLNAGDLSACNAQAGRSRLADSLQRALSEVRREELRLGQTQVGPHLDDLAFMINSREVRSFASQGQQRAIVLALKLAQIVLWKQYTGEVPVVLLDDVLFEFDRERRERVLTTIQNNAQVFLTVGDRTFSGDRVFYVESGNIEKES